MGQHVGLEEKILDAFSSHFWIVGHKSRRQGVHSNVAGLIGPGDRKSIQPMAERVARGECPRGMKT